jgi:hypothetical protein
LLKKASELRWSETCTSNSNPLLFNSHSDYGFIETLKSFSPSIAISEITKIGDNFYTTSSLRDKSLYFFNLDKNNYINNFKRVEVFEGVRDIAYKENKLYFF